MRNQVLGRLKNAALNNPGSGTLLSILPGGPDTTQIATGALTATNGTAVTQNASVSKFCTKSDGSLVWLTPRTNQALQSNAFGTSPWSIDNTTVAQNATDPFGAPNSAWTWTNNANNTQHRNDNASALSATGSFTWSIYAKAGTAGFLGLNFTNAGTATFDLSGGTVNHLDAGVTATITSVGNGWYRCAATMTNPGGTHAILLFGETAAQAQGFGSVYVGTSKTILLYGMQVEATQPANGLASPTTYIPTTTTTVTVNPVAVEPNGILVEAAGTNALTSSQDFSAWVAVNSGIGNPTVTQNTADLLAPDGTQTAAKIVTISSSGATYSFLHHTATNIGGTDARLSVWLRTASGTAQVFIGSDSADYPSLLCNVTSAWQRFEYTIAGHGTGLSCIIGRDGLLTDEAGTATTGATIYAWGYQVEKDVAKASSYMPTAAGATASRTADDVRVANPLAGLNPTAWSMGATVTPYAWTSASQGVLKLGTSYLAANTADLLVGTSGFVTLQVSDNAAGLKQQNANSTISAAAHRIVGQCNNGALSLLVDGALFASTTSGAGTGVVTTQNATMLIGQIQTGGTNCLGGWLHSIKVFNTANGR